MTNWKMPTGLGPKSQIMWDEVTGGYDLRVDEMRILEDCCREIDLVERLEDELRNSPLVVSGSMGQEVSSPLVSEIRQHRLVTERLLKALKLPDDDSGRVKEDASAKARRAANARWSRGA